MSKAVTAKVVAQDSLPGPTFQYWPLAGPEAHPPPVSLGNVDRDIRSAVGPMLKPS